MPEGQHCKYNESSNTQRLTAYTREHGSGKRSRSRTRTRTTLGLRPSKKGCPQQFPTYILIAVWNSSLINLNVSIRCCLILFPPRGYFACAAGQLKCPSFPWQQPRYQWVLTFFSYQILNTGKLLEESIKFIPRCYLIILEINWKQKTVLATN